jgi:YebC/PmpR family DNA-binding regulatory protein
LSGHSKWATTKHKKAAIDAKRGKLFAKLIKNIEIAAKMGGPDPAGNPTLYDAIQKAKKQSVPNDNIDRAVKRGGGLDGGGVAYDTIMYEVYGPSGVALLVECLTDNKNRAAMEVRTAVTRNGGTMADPGSVSRLFNRKGIVVLTKDQDGKEIDEDTVLEATLDAGAEEVNDLDDQWQVISEPSDVVAVRSALQDAGVDYESADVEFVATMDIPVSDPATAAKVMRLVDAIDDLDDVQNVFSNADISDDVLEAIDACAPPAPCDGRPRVAGARDRTGG